MMIVVATKSAMTLHLILTRTVLRAPMSFFDATDASIFLNRFSQDMSMVDMAVPASMFAFVLS
jgi:ATP-binding cassette subfamily C (CFTR/MRP) protein 1